MRKLANVVVLTTVLFAGAVACSEDDGSPPARETPTPSPALPAVTPFPAPTVVGRTLSSTAKKYSVTFPEGWVLRPNYATVGNESLDVAFLEEEIPSGPVRPSLAIGCMPVELIADLGEYVESRVAGLQQTLGQAGDVEERTVGGARAAFVTYEKLIGEERTATAGQESIRQVDVFFVGDVCAFTVSLLTSPEDASSLEPGFLAMLNSFEFLP